MNTKSVGSDQIKESILDLDNENNQEKRIALLTSLLRGLGATVIIAAAAVFLIRNWGYGNDIHRYLMLLGFTTLLSLAGFFCGLGLKDNKSARTLLGLCVAVVPVHFSVLGGLLYSQFPWDGSLGVLPNFAIWVAGDPVSALVTAGGALLVLVPLTYLSTLVLGRGGAKEFSVIFLLANILLLVPSRDASIAALLVAGLSGVLVWAEVRLLQPKTAMKTREGCFLRLMTAVPLVLIVTRNLRFYDYSALLLAAVLGALAAATFVLGPRLTLVESRKKMIEYCSVVPATGASILLTLEVMFTWQIQSEWIIPSLLLPPAALCIGMSFLSIGDGTGFRRAGVVTALASGLLQLALCPGLLSSLLCLLIGVTAVVYSCLVEQKIILSVGLISIICSLSYHLKYAVQLYSLSNWGILALTGLVIIILASLIEKNHRQVLTRVFHYRKRLGDWQY